MGAEPQKVSVLVPGYDGTDETSYYTKAIKSFEQQYGKTVEILQAVGEQLWNEKVAAQIAAKDPIDVFVISVDQYLSMYQKNYLTPVNEYVDLTRKGHNIQVMDDFVKFDGKYYAAGVSATPYVLYYNRDIMTANGYDPDEPMKRYEAGTWTWQSFVEIARECTDTDSGIVGLENMFDEVFQASNACSAVSFADGKYALNIKTSAMRNKIMVCKDNRSTLIAVQKYLGLHTVKAKSDRNIDSIVLALHDLSDSVFHIQFIRQGRNIRRTAYGNRNTADSTAFCKKTFIDKPCDMTEHIIVGTAGNHITIQNELPCVFQIQNFLHVGSRHAGYFSVLYDFLRLREGCCNPLQNSLIIDIHFHIGTRKFDVFYNISG